MVNKGNLWYNRDETMGSFLSGEGNDGILGGLVSSYFYGIWQELYSATESWVSFFERVKGYKVHFCFTFRFSPNQMRLSEYISALTGLSVDYKRFARLSDFDTFEDLLRGVGIFVKVKFDLRVQYRSVYRYAVSPDKVVQVVKAKVNEIMGSSPYQACELLGRETLYRDYGLVLS